MAVSDIGSILEALRLLPPGQRRTAALEGSSRLARRKQRNDAGRGWRDARHRNGTGAAKAVSLNPKPLDRPSAADCSPLTTSPRMPTAANNRTKPEGERAYGSREQMPSHGVTGDDQRFQGDSPLVWLPRSHSRSPTATHPRGVALHEKQVGRGRLVSAHSRGSARLIDRATGKFRPTSPLSISKLAERLRAYLPFRRQGR